MFIVEYRTKSRLHAGIHPSCFMNVGAHKAQSKEAAAEVAMRSLGSNVEIISVTLQTHFY